MRRLRRGGGFRVGDRASGYTVCMSLTLDPTTEQRIQQELARGRYREPAEVIAHALDLLEAERAELEERRSGLVRKLAKSFEQSERGETYSPEEARAMLAERRAARQ